MGSILYYQHIVPKYMLMNYSVFFIRVYKHLMGKELKSFILSCICGIQHDATW